MLQSSCLLMIVNILVWSVCSIKISEIKDRMHLGNDDRRGNDFIGGRPYSPDCIHSNFQNDYVPGPILGKAYEVNSMDKSTEADNKDVNPSIFFPDIIFVDKKKNVAWTVTNKACPKIQDLSQIAKDFLTYKWLNQGISEHSSIASFSLTIIELLTVGINSNLIERYNKALLDEINHAKLSFFYANCYNTNTTTLYQPGTYDSHQLIIINDYNIITSNVAKQACIGETLAYLLATLQAYNAKLNNKELYKDLNQIALEELNHSLLAWETLYYIKNNHHLQLDILEKSFWEKEIKDFFEPKFNALNTINSNSDVNVKDITDHGVLTVDNKLFLYNYLTDQIFPQLINTLIDQSDMSFQQILLNGYNTVLNL